MPDIGVIQEQGFPVGQFGFQPLSESEKKEIESKMDKEGGR